MDYTRLSLVEVRNALDDIVRDAEAVFGSLTPSQLNWRPDAARWSVAQCFQHLLTSDDLMLAAAMTSPFLAIITYSVLDACRLLVAHDRRHFEQARRVLSSTDFPRV